MRPDEVTFDVNTSATDRDVWTFTVLTPGYRLEVMTNPIAMSPDGRRATLRSCPGRRAQRDWPDEPAADRSEVL